MTVRVYEGRIHKGCLYLKEQPNLPEGALVYLLVPESIDEGTAFDPTPFQIATDGQVALDEFASGKIFEIKIVDDLERLIAESVPD
ncbi:MAG: hypothetical protein KA314_21750 [Chloroflexi bacterium]|jgi:hypothetical protein|nr:hypothetical protein [Chloroflexota bacterium]MBP8058465.1 hypothetical protein [Chloroflexota bacterium]